ncbi:MAG TPA: hypothetical protein VJR03_06090 [Nitrospira sp.]|nr:hypothetical protein [Nitrospira sp.]
MPTIWCAISGHGFGHAAQVIPILNELGRRVPRLTAIIRSSVAASFFQDRLAIPWSLQAVQQDVGCVQHGPLEIDVSGTWEAHKVFHATWQSRLAAEAAAMAAAAPTLILADTPYLPVSAGKRSGIPTVVAATFTWSEVLQCFGDASPEQQAIVEVIRRSYGEADFGLRIAPGLPLSGIPKVVDIGPIAEPAASERARLRACLGVMASERLVLMGFGGIPLDGLPWDEMDRMKGYRFLATGLPPGIFSRIHSLSEIPFSFKTALASVDVVMTKPGYGTILEAVALGLPVVYVRRYNFADESSLVQFLHAYGQGCELSRSDFVSGNWQAALDRVAGLKRESPTNRVLLTGAVEGAQALLHYFQ